MMAEHRPDGGSAAVGSGAASGGSTATFELAAGVQQGLALLGQHFELLLLLYWSLATFASTVALLPIPGAGAFRCEARIALPCCRRAAAGQLARTADGPLLLSSMPAQVGRAAVFVPRQADGSGAAAPRAGSADALDRAAALVCALLRAGGGLQRRRGLAAAGVSLLHRSAGGAAGGRRAGAGPTAAAPVPPPG